MAARTRFSKPSQRASLVADTVEPTIVVDDAVEIDDGGARRPDSFVPQAASSSNTQSSQTAAMGDGSVAGLTESLRHFLRRQSSSALFASSCSEGLSLDISTEPRLLEAFLEDAAHREGGGGGGACLPPTSAALPHHHHSLLALLRRTCLRHILLLCPFVSEALPPPPDDQGAAVGRVPTGREPIFGPEPNAWTLLSRLWSGVDADAAGHLPLGARRQLFGGLVGIVGSAIVQVTSLPSLDRNGSTAEAPWITVAALFTPKRLSVLLSLCDLFWSAARNGATCAAAAVSSDSPPSLWRSTDGTDAASPHPPIIWHLLDGYAAILACIETLRRYAWGAADALATPMSISSTRGTHTNALSAAIAKLMSSCVTRLEAAVGALFIPAEASSVEGCVAMATLRDWMSHRFALSLHGIAYVACAAPRAPLHLCSGVEPGQQQQECHVGHSHSDFAAFSSEVTLSVVLSIARDACRRHADSSNVAIDCLRVSLALLPGLSGIGGDERNEDHGDDEASTFPFATSWLQALASAAACASRRCVTLSTWASAASFAHSDYSPEMGPFHRWWHCAARAVACCASASTSPVTCHSSDPQATSVLGAMWSLLLFSLVSAASASSNPCGAGDRRWNDGGPRNACIADVAVERVAALVLFAARASSEVVRLQVLGAVLDIAARSLQVRWAATAPSSTSRDVAANSNRCEDACFVLAQLASSLITLLDDQAASSTATTVRRRTGTRALIHAWEGAALAAAPLIDGSAQQDGTTSLVLRALHRRIPVLLLVAHHVAANVADSRDDSSSREGDTPSWEPLAAAVIEAWWEGSRGGASGLRTGSRDEQRTRRHDECCHSLFSRPTRGTTASAGFLALCSHVPLWPAAMIIHAVAAVSDHDRPNSVGGQNGVDENDVIGVAEGAVHELRLLSALFSAPVVRGAFMMSAAPSDDPAHQGGHTVIDDVIREATRAGLEPVAVQRCVVGALRHASLTLHAMAVRLAQGGDTSGSLAALSLLHSAICDTIRVIGSHPSPCRFPLVPIDVLRASFETTFVCLIRVGRYLTQRAMTERASASTQPTMTGGLGSASPLLSWNDGVSCFVGFAETTEVAIESFFEHHEDVLSDVANMVEELTEGAPDVATVPYFIRLERLDACMLQQSKPSSDPAWVASAQRRKGITGDAMALRSERDVDSQPATDEHDLFCSGASAQDVVNRPIGAGPSPPDVYVDPTPFHSGRAVGVEANQHAAPEGVDTGAAQPSNDTDDELALLLRAARTIEHWRVARPAQHGAKGVAHRREAVAALQRLSAAFLAEGDGASH